jgi:putative DNA primase/helicase
MTDQIIVELKRRRDKKRAERAEKDGTPCPMLPPPSDPMAVARVFVQQHCQHDGGPLTLYFWRGGWWEWRTTHWVEVEIRSVRGKLYRFTEHAFYHTGKLPMPWQPTSNKISNVLDALTAITHLPEELDQPTWLDDREGDVVAVGNGLLDIKTRQLHPHTPLYFNQTSVPFKFDPEATEAAYWLSFLTDLWPHEMVAIDVLGEWFGYIVSGRTDLHKIFLMVGPTRGGKGAIARILTALVGKKNVAGPTLNSLGGDFGLAPLIGKPLAIISDARFSGKSANVVVERLLSISGEDTLTVNRKYRDQWTGQLPTRLHVISNELPKLGDASTAVVGRIVLLMLTQSWLGKEDHDLEQRLHEELPAILNWSLDGLERLNANGGRFTRLPTAEEAIVAMRDLASPVAAFVRERCQIEDGAEVEVEAVYLAYKVWCELNEHRKSTMQTFGRDLRAAVPSIRKTRMREGDDRHHVYTGITLRPAT